MSVEIPSQSTPPAAADTHAVAEPVAAPTVDPPVPAGNPALLGLPTFLPGAITLGLWLVGYLDTATLPGGMISAVLLSSGLFGLIAAVWASRVGMSAVAGIFGTFAAFWISFGFLVMGLVNGWFGVSADDAALAATQVGEIQRTFVLSWLIVFVVVTLATLRLPLAFTALFLLVDATFALVLAFVITGTTIFATLGGLTTFGFCAVGAYLFFDGMSQELGGRAYPLGSPIGGRRSAAA